MYSDDDHRDIKRVSSKDHHRYHDHDRDGDREHRHRRTEKPRDDEDRRRRSRDYSPDDDFDRRRERSSSRARDSVDVDQIPRESSRKRKERGDEEKVDRDDRRRRRDRDEEDLNRKDDRELGKKRREEDVVLSDREDSKYDRDSRNRSREDRVRLRKDYGEEKGVKGEILSEDEERQQKKDSRKVVEDEERVVDKNERREGRRFVDRVKEEDLGDVADSTIDNRLENGRDRDLSKEKHGSGDKVIAQEPQNLHLKTSSSSAVSHRPLPDKVSSIITTNENARVSIRSDEVPGKSTTDGQPPAKSKSGSLSLDALAKAKKALQMQKELSEKLKKIPLLNKVGSTSENSHSSLNRDRNKVPLSTDPHVGISGSSTVAAMSTHSSVGSVMPGKQSVPGEVAAHPGLASIANIEAVKRAQELAAKMGFRQDPEFEPIINMFPGKFATDMAVLQKPAKAPVLRLDAQGREVDEHGNVINMPKLTNLSTLKVNINKKKKEAFQIIKPDLDAIAQSSSHFDEGMGINKTKILRPKRMSFQFVEEGKWAKQAEIIKLKSQFGEAQAKELKMKQTQLAKAKAEPEINPNLIAVGVRTFKEKKKEEIPDIEWWDKPILPAGSYNDISEEKLNMEKINIYVEHPRPIEPPAEPAPPPPQPLKLTKKEQKKLRTQKRLAKERDRQDMIRQGLLEPPKPKVKMSNLMKVLGSEATQDPTKLEMEVRAAAAEREQAHIDRNIARKLTPSERRQKKEKKLFDDSSCLETIVSVYKIKDLSHPQTRFKVDVNAQENRLTGSVVISDSMTVVVVEGGQKPIKRYSKLMLKRINWAAAVSNEDEETDNNDGPPNSCVLVWQGSVAKPSFYRFLVHQCRSDSAAKKVFADAGVPHYWDLALNFKEELL